VLSVLRSVQCSLQGKGSESCANQALIRRLIRTPRSSYRDPGRKGTHDSTFQQATSPSMRRNTRHHCKAEAVAIKLWPWHSRAMTLARYSNRARRSNGAWGLSKPRRRPRRRARRRPCVYARSRIQAVRARAVAIGRSGLRHVVSAGPDIDDDGSASS
jgi:hypothetical protein